MCARRRAWSPRPVGPHAPTGPLTGRGAGMAATLTLRPARCCQLGKGSQTVPGQQAESRLFTQGRPGEGTGVSAPSWSVVPRALRGRILRTLHQKKLACLGSVCLGFLFGLKTNPMCLVLTAPLF